jgi:hypothetical protein
MIRPVVVIAFDDQIFPGIKTFQPGENGIPFCEAGISSAVDTE